MTPKAIEEAEQELLKRAIGCSPLKVYIWPERDDGILDTPDMKPLVLRAADGAAMGAFLERKGGTPRVNRNTLFFLAPLGGEHTALATLLRKRLAYDTLSKDAWQGDAPAESPRAHRNVCGPTNAWFGEDMVQLGSSRRWRRLSK